MNEGNSKFSPLTLLVISRPVNVLLTALSVVVGGIISVNLKEIGVDLLYAAFSASLIAAGGNAFNDYCDRELDRIQKAHRPIPSGRITPSAALIWSALCFLGGIMLSLMISGVALSIALGAVILLLLYSWRWKSKPLIGNLTVSLVAALAFIYGGVAVGMVGTAFWAAVLAFFFHLGREIIKDMEDRSGDKKARAGTFVVQFGPTAGRYAATLAFVLLIVSLPLPFYFGNYSIVYIYIVLLGVLPVILTNMVLAWKWSKPHQLHVLSTLLKIDMLVGLTALILGRPLN